jgi:hypothetical protein
MINRIISCDSSINKHTHTHARIKRPYFPHIHHSIPVYKSVTSSAGSTSSDSALSTIFQAELPPTDPAMVGEPGVVMGLSAERESRSMDGRCCRRPPRRIRRVKRIWRVGSSSDEFWSAALSSEDWDPVCLDSIF